MKVITSRMTLLASIMFTLSGTASATLIGDTVACATSSASWACTSPTAVVGGGNEFELFLTGPAIDAFFVDIDASSILFGVTNGVGNIFGLGPVTLSDLDWTDAPGFISGFDFVTDVVGMDASRLSFTADSFSIDFDGLSTDFGQSLLINLTVRHDVPEPGLLSLFVAGLLGLGLRRRKTS